MKKYSKKGLKIGLVFGLVMTIILAVSYTDFFPSIGVNPNILTIILIPYLIPFSIIMFNVDNPSCGLKHGTDCVNEIALAMLIVTIFFTFVGYLIGLITDRVKAGEIKDNYK